MADPKPENENSWRKRLMRFFRRDKTGAPNKKTETTSQARDKRAFNISMVIGVMQVLGYTSTKISNPNHLGYGSLIAMVCAFISAWLVRRGRTTVGVILTIIGMCVGAIFEGAAQYGVGMAVAAILLLVILGITSATMPPAQANRVNVIGLFVAAIPVLLDLFEPFALPRDPTPVATLSLTLIFIMVFAVIVIRRFNTYSLRSKLIIAFAAVTLVPLLIIAVYDTQKLSDALYQSAQKSLSQFANQTAIQVDTFIKNQLTSIEVQAQDPSFVQYLSLDPSQRTNVNEEKSAQDALAALAHQDTKFVNAVMLLDKKGMVLLDTVNRRGQDDSQTQFFKQPITQNRSTMSGPFIDQKTSKASLYFSTPVKNQAGALLGVLVMEYNANVIENVVQSIVPSVNSQGILFRIVDKNNFVRIADTDTTHPELRYTSFKDLTPTQVATLQKQGLLLPGTTQNALAVESETVTGLESLEKSPFFTTIVNKTLQTKNLNSGAQLKNVPWLAFVRQSEAVVLAQVVEQRRITTLIFIFLLVLVTLAAFGLSQLLANPILRLAAVAQKIAAGDLTLQSDIESNDEIGTLATAFNQMTRQTRALINSLEQRSKALATSSEVSRRISTILDQQELVTEVVKQVQLAFGYYHAHIYLLDENTQELIMAGGTGEAGKAMLARNHKIPMGKGLVGRAAQNNITVLVTNVAEEPQWLPNPLLPDTKSEVAVPIAIAERVIGVLDVQHNVADTLKQEDVDVLQSIANQVAFAVRNARSYSDVQAKADRESLISSIGQKIQGTITVESAMQVAIREIGRALNGAKTQITLNENSTAEHAHDDEGSILQPEN